MLFAACSNDSSEDDAKYVNYNGQVCKVFECNDGHECILYLNDKGQNILVDLTEESQNPEPDDPGDKPGNEGGDNSGDKPGNEGGDNSGDKPGNEGGDNSGDKPGNEGGDNSGDKPGNEGGDVPADTDDETDGEVHRIRFMAANITSGNHQTYQEPGIHVFQALKPDIVMIQEFSYEEGTRDDLVKLAFGEDYYYSFSPEDTPSYTANVIPNGIISRYPIIESGWWDAEGGASNRNWDWAIIDIPGPRDVFAVSVHLTINGTATERPKLIKKIKAKIGEDNPNNYYLVIGGDFNTKSRGGVESDFKSLFRKKSESQGTYPVDQNGSDLTSGERDDPYDWVLFSYDLDELEVPVKIGSHVYPNGHVFDACVYYELGELADVSPVVASDCGEVDDTTKTVISRVMNMQHMAVIRDIEYVNE